MNSDFDWAMYQFELDKIRNREFFKNFELEREKKERDRNVQEAKYVMRCALVKSYLDQNLEFEKGEIERWFLSEDYNEPLPKLKKL